MLFEMLSNGQRHVVDAANLATAVVTWRHALAQDRGWDPNDTKVGPDRVECLSRAPLLRAPLTPPTVTLASDEYEAIVRGLRSVADGVVENEPDFEDIAADFNQFAERLERAAKETT